MCALGSIIEDTAETYELLRTIHIFLHNRRICNTIVVGIWGLSRSDSRYVSLGESPSV